jgi:hypothetical protein
MFCRDITSSDAFTEMPLSAQALYFHLGLAADVSGFVTPKGTMRLINANVDDLKTLIAKQFVIPFESGVVVITHWNMHNNIREDREAKTIYQKELKQLETKEGEYQLRENSGSTPAQIRLDKVRLGKINLVANATDKKEFSFKSKMQEMKTGRRAAQIIALYWDYKGIEYENEKQYQAGFKRELRPATALAGYSNDKIEGVMIWLNNPSNCDFNWTLETCHKLIDQPNLKSFKKQPQASGSLY